MIYPSIVTTDGNHFKKLEEATKLGLEEVCFFATQLSLEERKNFYELLERTKIRRIPLVHIRQDFEIWELAYLSKTFSVETFNCHSSREFPLKNDISPWKKKIFIENTVPLQESEIREYAGICLDFSHLEDNYFLRRDVYESNIKILDNCHIGCAHISTFKKICLVEKIVNHRLFRTHRLQEFSDMNYLEKYQKYFPPIMALELENSLEEQLKIIDYLSSKTWASKV